MLTAARFMEPGPVAHPENNGETRKGTADQRRTAAPRTNMPGAETIKFGFKHFDEERSCGIKHKLHKLRRLLFIECSPDL